MHLQNSLKKVLFLGLSTLMFISCGGSKPMVENVNVSTEQIDGDIYVNLSADLGIGNVQLPAATFPIILPRSGKEVGTLSLQTNLEGKNQIEVSVNVSETANLDLQNVNLPNGANLPLIGDRPVIVVPIGKGAEVYISVSQDSAALGLSIPIKTFDALGAKVGTTAIMPVFNTNGVFGAAGIYTSKIAGQNGFAMVADVSGLLGNLVKNNILEDHMSRMPQSQVDDFDYSTLSPNRSQEKAINSELFKMHKRKQKLELN